MNKRIRELAELSIKESGQEFWWLTNDLVIEKFAQLIAQESIVDFYRRYLDICSEEDITVQVERYVKEHFGVEE